MNNNPKQDAIGRFVRTRQLWDGTNWNDGHIDNKGRFRVYRPDYPRAYTMGYAMRAHVVYWLKTGEAHPVGTVLHHVNEDRLDDRFENLEVKLFGQHTIDHKKKPEIMRECRQCGNVFVVKRQRGKARTESRAFCTLACYYAYPKSTETRQRQSRGLKRAYQEGRRLT